jgi:hypothetical protein
VIAFAYAAARGGPPVELRASGVTTLQGIAAALNARKVPL